jgi:peptidoglycan/LPS O-acetylase OafA/YrhL
MSPQTALLMCVPVAANGVLAGLLGGVQQTPLFDAFSYLNLAFQCLAVAALSLMTRTPFLRLDKLFGDLSYPVFLCHWLVGYVLAMLVFPGQLRGIGLMVATLVASTGVAYIICQLQDAIVEPLRFRIRTDAETNHQELNAKAAMIRTSCAARIK